MARNIWGDNPASYEEISGRMRQQREEDLKRGEERAKKKYAVGEADPSAFRDIIKQRQEQTQGLTGEERQAMEQQGLRAIQQAEQTQARQLAARQGAAGIRGGLAMAQQRDVAEQGLEARAGLAQDIFLENINKRREALNQLESTLGRERLGGLTMEFGEAGLGAAERGAAIQSAVGGLQTEQRTPKAGKK